MQCTGYRKRPGLLLQPARPVDHCTPSPNIWCCYCPHGRPAVEPTVPQMSIPGTASPDPPWEAREPSSDPDMFSILPLPDPPPGTREELGPTPPSRCMTPPQLSPQNPMMSQMREKGSSGKRQLRLQNSRLWRALDGGGGRHCGVLADEKAGHGVQGSPLTFIAASLLVVFLSRPLSADMRVSCNSNGSGLSVAVGGRAPAP